MTLPKVTNDISYISFAVINLFFCAGSGILLFDFRGCFYGKMRKNEDDTQLEQGK